MKKCTISNETLYYYIFYNYFFISWALSSDYLLVIILNQTCWEHNLYWQMFNELRIQVDVGWVKKVNISLSLVIEKLSNI